MFRFGILHTHQCSYRCSYGLLGLQKISLSARDPASYFPLPEFMSKLKKEGKRNLAVKGGIPDVTNPVSTSFHEPVSQHVFFENRASVPQFPTKSDLQTAKYLTLIRSFPYLGQHLLLQGYQQFPWVEVPQPPSHNSVVSKDNVHNQVVAGKRGWCSYPF